MSDPGEGEGLSSSNVESPDKTPVATVRSGVDKTTVRSSKSSVSEQNVLGSIVEEGSQGIRERIIDTYRNEIEAHKLNDRNFATLRA